MTLFDKCFYWSPDKLEEGGAVFRHPVIWPRGELELLDFSPVCVTHLEKRIVMIMFAFFILNSIHK